MAISIPRVVIESARCVLNAIGLVLVISVLAYGAVRPQSREDAINNE